ncbi:tRNA (adenosine(37)-N6)-threonylcarbamoyltransferase complex transferase subunit TsaD [Bacteroidia bacterium]|nr:tRNA (adenosine(37)-N6)-threonylcarbamoyltransferase complex transferase subunit TsaD [Bacteroidia bacterium]
MANPLLKSTSTILGIESSCDDTSASVIQNGEIRSNIISSQEIHRKYGGVVPELASRAHQSHIIPVIHEALETAKVSKKDLDAIAVTQGPGLMGSLIVGLNTAKGLAMSLGIPLIGVNHLRAHVSALQIENKIEYPMLCLLVSGGHTQLILQHNENDAEIIGSTIDDAVGEAFDKGSKIMGLGYPGGPVIAKLAEKGNRDFHKFPNSQTKDLDFSFSGIKTSLLYWLRKELEINSEFLNEHREDICASYEKSLVNMLLKRVKKALKIHNVKSLGLVGGVSANRLLRIEMKEMGNRHNLQVYIPSFEYCTDNAAMIAKAGEILFRHGDCIGLEAKPYTRA